jgi:hypothetical protein
MAGETPLGDWTSALQKAQSDLMRQWLDMNAAWARATSPQAAAGAGVAGGGSAGAGGAASGAGPGAAPASGAIPGMDGGDVARRFLEQCEQYLGVSRSLWELVGRSATAPDAEQRGKLFNEGLGLLQQQFAGLWAATPFGAGAAQANPMAAFGLPAFGAPGFGAPGFGAPGFGAPAGGANPFAAGFGALPAGFPGFPPAAFTGLFNQPALGPTREQQQAWQQLSQVAARCGQAQLAVVNHWNDIIGKSLRELGERLAPRLKSGATPGSLKEIYDLWVDSAEGVYAQVARNAGFVQAQAELTNALSALRASQRELVEDWSRQFDLPTRAELNSIHQQLRELKAALKR